MSVLRGHHLIEEAYTQPLAGVDKLSLEEHTTAVLGCYENFFEGHEALALSNGHFKLLLSLHDLGKPRAVAERQFDKQHDYTCRLIDALCNDTALPRLVISKIKTIISGDPIGLCLNKKSHVSVEQSRRVVAEMAEKLGITMRECWSTILVYYQCDVSGYGSLRRKVFLSDSLGRQIYSMEKRRFLFRDPEEAERFEALGGAVR